MNTPTTATPSVEPEQVSAEIDLDQQLMMKLWRLPQR
jgi:hypothetical protein